MSDMCDDIERIEETVEEGEKEVQDNVVPVSVDTPVPSTPVQDSNVRLLCEALEEHRANGTVGSYINEATDGQTILSRAASEGQIHCVMVLVNEKSIDLAAQGNSAALESAARGGHVNVVRLMCRFKKVQLGNALIVAAESGHVSCVETLLEEDMVVTRESLREAVELVAGVEGGEEIAQCLLKDPRAPKTLALFHAVKTGNVDCLRRVLAADAVDLNVIVDDRTAVMLAVENGRSECLQLLLEQPTIDIAIRQQEGDRCTAEEMAGSVRQFECFFLLTQFAKQRMIVVDAEKREAKDEEKREAKNEVADTECDEEENMETNETTAAADLYVVISDSEELETSIETPTAPVLSKLESPSVASPSTRQTFGDVMKPTADGYECTKCAAYKTPKRTTAYSHFKLKHYHVPSAMLDRPSVCASPPTGRRYAEKPPIMRNANGVYLCPHCDRQFGNPSSAHSHWNRVHAVKDSSHYKNVMKLGRSSPTPSSPLAAEPRAEYNAQTQNMEDSGPAECCGFRFSNGKQRFHVCSWTRDALLANADKVGLKKSVCVVDLVTGVEKVVCLMCKAECVRTEKRREASDKIGAHGKMHNWGIHG